MPHPQKEGWIYFTTPNLYQFMDIGINWANVTNITFQVEACNDAHIALSENFEQYGSRTYEIVLGGWSNTQSAIR